MTKWRNSGWYPPPSKPRAVDGGIKARSKRGAIGESWWSQRFIGVLEGMGMGSRLQRGKRYARAGQVISLDVEPGLVTATVQGSRARPYRVRIGVSAFGKEEWIRVEQALAGSAWYTARLLAGEMPTDIEELFDQLQLSLFPTTSRDLSLDCTCPDAAVPCKHLAAAFYLLAERFDADPFSILAWRGREREDLLDNLQAERSGVVAADAGEQAGVPLEECLDSFFEAQAEIPRLSPPAVGSEQMLDDLPPVELTIRGRQLYELLGPVYARLAGSGDQLMGGADGE